MVTCPSRFARLEGAQHDDCSALTSKSAIWTRELRPWRPMSEALCAARRPPVSRSVIVSPCNETQRSSITADRTRGKKLSLLQQSCRCRQHALARTQWMSSNTHHIEKVDMMNQAVQRTRRRLMSAGEPSTSVSAASTRRSRPLSSCSRVSSRSAPSCCPSQLSASFSACAAVPNHMPFHIALHYISVRSVLADANRGALKLTVKAFNAMDDPMQGGQPLHNVHVSACPRQQGELANSHLRRTGRVLANKMGPLPGQLKSRCRPMLW